MGTSADVKEAWQIWRGTSALDKDVHKTFERLCTPKAFHDLLIELETLNAWIPVDGVKDIPVGDWLVYMPDNRTPMQTANIHKNISTIGNQFDFDMPKVTAYKKLPETP